LVRSGCRWTDPYLGREEEKDELETLLEFAQKKGQLGEYVSRLRCPEKHRNAALMELRVAFYLEENGFLVVGWSPAGVGGHFGEFAVEGTAKQRVFVEVKGPEWEWQGQVQEDELKAGRSGQPKYIDMECRSIRPPWKAIQFAVDKAYGRLRDNVSNLVVSAGDLFVSLEHETDSAAQEALYSNSPPGFGYFTDQRYQNLGGVGVFWVTFEGICISEHGRGRPVYHMRLYLNPNALSATALPPDLQAAFRNEPVQPKVPLVGREPSQLERYLADSQKWK
jgi:hypothetical protein